MEVGQVPMEDRVHLEARVRVEVAVPVGMVPIEAVGVVPAVAGDVVPAVAGDEAPVEVVVMVVVGLVEDSFQAHFLGRKLTFPLINPQHHSLFHLPLALMSL